MGGKGHLLPRGPDNSQSTPGQGSLRDSMFMAEFPLITWHAWHNRSSKRLQGLIISPVTALKYIYTSCLRVKISHYPVTERYNGWSRAWWHVRPITQHCYIEQRFNPASSAFGTLCPIYDDLCHFKQYYPKNTHTSKEKSLSHSSLFKGVISSLYNIIQIS